MGSALRVIGAGAEHIRAQSQIDAARILQASSNKSKLSLVESQKIVQTANNAAADVYAADRKRLQDSSNALSLATANGQKSVQAAYNANAQALADAKAVVQASRNERAGVDSDIARWSQSLGNQIKMDRTGEQVNQITTDVLRFAANANTGSIQDRLANASALGAQIATAAAAGTGGNATAMYNSSMALQAALKQEQEHRALTGKISDAYMERGQTLRDGINSMENSAYSASLDYSTTLAEKDYSFIFADQDVSAIYADHDFTAYSADLDFTQYVDHKKMSGLQQVGTFAAAAAATYFGGPSAGAAVFDASNALYDMSSGNLAKAQASLKNAVNNTSAGWKTWRGGASNGSAGGAWGKAAATKIGAFLKI